MGHQNSNEEPRAQERLDALRQRQDQERSEVEEQYISMVKYQRREVDEASRKHRYEIAAFERRRTKMKARHNQEIRDVLRQQEEEAEAPESPPSRAALGRLPLRQEPGQHRLRSPWSRAHPCLPPPDA